MRRGPRLLQSALHLHDVRDVEAHVRVLLDARLGEWGARLDAEQYDDALTYLLEKAWELSGLDSDGITMRLGWRVRVFTDPEELEDGDAGEDRGWYALEDRAQRVAAAIATNQPGTIVELYVSPPPGAYDSTLGLSFSTYSRRILTARVVDWYRSTFGDTRYNGRRLEESLDALAEKWDHDGGDEGYLDRDGPGGDVTFIDDLNRHAYNDPMEEVLTHVALGG